MVLAVRCYGPWRQPGCRVSGMRLLPALLTCLAVAVQAQTSTTVSDWGGAWGTTRDLNSIGMRSTPFQGGLGAAKVKSITMEAVGAAPCGCCVPISRDLPPNTRPSTLTLRAARALRREGEEGLISRAVCGTYNQPSTAPATTPSLDPCTACAAPTPARPT